MVDFNWFLLIVYFLNYMAGVGGYAIYKICKLTGLNRVSESFSLRNVKTLLHICSFAFFKTIYRKVYIIAQKPMQSLIAITSVATHFEKITHFEKKFQSALIKFWTKSAHFEHFFSKCVKCGTNFTHFEIFFQSALSVQNHFYLSNISSNP